MLGNIFFFCNYTYFTMTKLCYRLQNRLLSHVVTLPPNEVVQVLEAISGTPTGGAMACRFLQAKWYDLQSKMGAGSILFAKVISAITKYGATKFDYDEVSETNVLYSNSEFVNLSSGIMTLKHIISCEERHGGFVV